MTDLKLALKSALAKVFVPELDVFADTICQIKDIEQGERLSLDITLPSFGLRSEKDIVYSIKKFLMRYENDPSQVDINVYSDVKPLCAQSINIKDIADVRNVILVASGKGGVGKSTVSANLAYSLASLGARVGLLDADVYGPSIPTMYGLKEEGLVKGFLKEDSKITYMIPPIKHNVALMSLGFLVDKNASMIWRGPMISQACMQMFYNVFWGQLDYLIVDLPPGTGDIQLSIAQKVNVAGAIIVSTPQDVALMDVIRAKTMFDKVNIPILGLVENMSYFVCDACEKRHEIFSHGGAKDIAKSLFIKVLAELALNTEIRKASDIGEPLGFLDLAHDLVSILVKMGLNSQNIGPVKRRLSVL